MSKYSSEFKLEVIKYYLENNVGYQTAADHFGIAYSPVLRWVRKYKENGYVGLMKNQRSSVVLQLMWNKKNRKKVIQVV